MAERKGLLYLVALLARALVKALYVITAGCSPFCFISAFTSRQASDPLRGLGSHQPLGYLPDTTQETLEKHLINLRVEPASGDEQTLHLIIAKRGFRCYSLGKNRYTLDLALRPLLVVKVAGWDTKQNHESR